MHIKTDLYTHIMKYMGSKRELLETIREVVLANYDGNGAFLDLFAGTCGVGMALRDVAPIYSNDIQYYSKVIADGTLSVKAADMMYRVDIEKLLQKDFDKNMKALENLLPERLKASKRFIACKDWKEEDRVSYISFMEGIAAQVLDDNVETDKESTKLREMYKERMNDPSLFPLLQNTHLFSEMYFSTEQAMMIDSLVFAIKNLNSKDMWLKDLLIAALIHAFSYNSAGTGHFAQFRDMSTTSSIKDVFHYRRQSVLDYFYRKAEELIAVSQKNHFPTESRSYSVDYMELLQNSKIMNNVSIIYADPPYSFVHYSRFYHAIEDLAKYDYPAVEHKGRYRQDRHQSPFCIKTKAPGAFHAMFEAAYKFKKPILVSYSNTGMISLDKLFELAKDAGYRISALEIDHKHSTMGRLNDKHRDVKEALVLCSVD